MSQRDLIDLRRPPPSRDPKKNLLVLHSNGIDSVYLHWLKRATEHSHIAMVDIGARSIAEALSEAKRLAKLARVQGSRYDEVWILHSDEVEQGILDSAAKANVSIAASAPCFERWLLLHFEDVPAGATADEIRARLLIYLPLLDADPGDSMIQLAGRYDAARTRVARDAAVGPQTVDALVESLLASLMAFRGPGTKSPSI